MLGERGHVIPNGMCRVVFMVNRENGGQERRMANVENEVERAEITAAVGNKPPLPPHPYNPGSSTHCISGARFLQISELPRVYGCSGRAKLFVTKKK